jgi:hypothetical protein
MVINWSSLHSRSPTTDRERGAKIPRQRFLDEELGLNNNPSRTRDHTRSWCIRSIQNQNLAPEIRKRRLVMYGCSTHRAAALDLGAAPYSISLKVSFSSTQILAQHFRTSVPTIKDVLQTELGLRNSRGSGCPIFCPAPKRLLVLKHQQRCHEFYTSRKRINLKESQQVTSLGSNIPIPTVVKTVCTIADRCHSKDAAGDRGHADYDNDFRHRTPINRAPHLTERK